MVRLYVIRYYVLLIKPEEVRNPTDETLHIKKEICVFFLYVLALARSYLFSKSTMEGATNNLNE